MMQGYEHLPCHHSIFGFQEDLLEFLSHHFVLFPVFPSSLSPFFADMLLYVFILLLSSWVYVPSFLILLPQMFGLNMILSNRI